MDSAGRCFGGNMDHPAKLTLALCILLSGAAHAGYAQLAPPAGAGTVAGNLAYRTAANEAWVQSTVRTSASLNVGGRLVTVPVAMRVAANASTLVARTMFTHPLILAGTLAAPALYAWAKSNDFWVGRNSAGQNIWYQEVKTPIDSCTPLTQAQQTALNSCIQGGNSPSYTSFTPDTKSDGNSCSYGYTFTFLEYGTWKTVSVFNACVSTPVVKQTEVTIQEATPSGFENKMGQGAIPGNVLPELPFGVPVDLPIINPSPSLAPQPLFVPTGNPRLNPNYNPNAPATGDNLPYLRPGVKVVPAPTQANPWQVDLQPVDRPVASPNPGEDVDPSGQPNPDPVEDPNAETDKPKPEDQKGLCEQFPDIVACATLGKPGEAKPVPDQKKDLSITPESGFGPGGGSCPPPRTVQVSGLTLSMPFDLLCDFASGIKPVIVGLAWLSAAFTFMGIGRRA